MSKNFSIVIISLFSALSVSCFAQEIDIVPYLKMIEQGKLIEVKEKFINLKSDNPGSTNLIFLEAVLTENGQDAVSLYQQLVEKYPKSSYADAALYRLYSYYFALGLYNTADKNLEKLKKSYPESPYIKMISVNVVNNEPENSEPDSRDTSQPEKEIQDNFTVQAGAFTSSVNASALKKEVDNAGMISFIKDKNVAGTTFKVVYIGKFATRKEAEDFLAIANSRFNIAGRVVEIEK